MSKTTPFEFRDNREPVHATFDPGHTWVISDTHFFHKNIIEYCERPFKGVREMNDFILQKWYETVPFSDTVIHLGDVIMLKGSSEQSRIWCKETFSCLPGKKVLVKGNHDRGAMLREPQEWGFDWAAPYIIDEPNKLVFKHIPERLRGYSVGWHLVHGHVHNKPVLEEDRGERQLNVSVEVTDYKPVRLKDLLGV